MKTTQRCQCIVGAGQVALKKEGLGLIPALLPARPSDLPLSPSPCSSSRTPSSRFCRASSAGTSGLTLRRP